MTNSEMVTHCNRISQAVNRSLNPAPIPKRTWDAREILKRKEWKGATVTHALDGSYMLTLGSFTATIRPLGYKQAISKEGAA